MYLMDKYQVTPDPWDNRIIRFNNCVMLLSCVCNIASIFISEVRDLAEILRIISDIVYMTTVGCMTGQMVFEMDYQEQNAPKAHAIVRD
ncbi:unnamed protein product [Discosporangium mesarthrocarpum]